MVRKNLENIYEQLKNSDNLPTFLIPLVIGIIVAHLAICFCLCSNLSSKNSTDAFK